MFRSKKWTYYVVVLFVVGAATMIDNFRRISTNSFAAVSVFLTMAKSSADATAADTIEIGVLSGKDASFFRALQSEIDDADQSVRCQRYSATYNVSKSPPTKRRIFYGALIANEPWELMEIVAAESYGIYQGMVFVEGNRTQNLTPRPFQRLQHGPTFAKMFGLPESQVQVRAFVNEDSSLEGLSREHEQRAEIIKGWIELGMKPGDVGYLGDSDETFTRDFLRAVQRCDGINVLDYESHYCEHTKVKLIATTRVFETSPECVTSKREWYHPDIIMGHCIEGIGDSAKHPTAPRQEGSFLRVPGFGGDGNWELEKNVTDGRYNLWNAADFRRARGGNQIRLEDESTPPRFDQYTAFHFHNFFTEFNKTRFKYRTYGHVVTGADRIPIEDLSVDLKLMYKCAKDLPDDPKERWPRVQGGFETINLFQPIYFQDEDYRRRRHAHVQDMVEADERYIKSLN